MSKPDNVLDKRTVNALFKNADINVLGKLMLGFDGKIGLAITKKMVGGLWVGGNAYLTPEAVEFHPNVLNKLFHNNAEALRVTIPLVALVSVETRLAIGPKLIDLNTQDATLSMRCLNSIRFADAIDTARHKVQSAD